MRKFAVGLALGITALLIVPSAHAAGSSYPENLGKAWFRGVKNIVSFPLEIPLMARAYDSAPGLPVIRHMGGAVEGVFRGIGRLGAGLWDIPAGLIPGFQEGIPMDPETLF